MSLYNQMCGVNPHSQGLLSMIGKSPIDFPRYRDVYAHATEDYVIVFTRTGGGNRDAYHEENEDLKKIEGYMGDFDDPFDMTFAHWQYEVKPEFRENLNWIRQNGGSFDPLKRMMQIVEDLNDPTKTYPDVVKARIASGMIMEKLKKAIDDGESGVVLEV